jgi:hypothetical protein
MPKWDKAVTKQDIEDSLGPELAGKAMANAREAHRLARTVAMFKDEPRKGVVRILYGPSPKMEPDENLPPGAMPKAYTIFWLGGPQSAWPPDDHPTVLLKGVNPAERHKFMGWLVKDRQTTIDLVKAYWGVELVLPAEELSS